MFFLGIDQKCRAVTKASTKGTDWLLLLSGDGFHAHKFTLAAQALFHEMKTLHLIEESDSSHVNQAFDREVAKSGKATARETLPLVIRHKVFGPSEHLDQWQLLVIACLEGRRPANIGADPRLSLRGRDLRRSV